MSARLDKWLKQTDNLSAKHDEIQKAAQLSVPKAPSSGSIISRLNNPINSPSVSKAVADIKSAQVASRLDNTISSPSLNYAIGSWKDAYVADRLNNGSYAATGGTKQEEIAQKAKEHKRNIQSAQVAANLDNSLMGQATRDNQKAHFERAMESLYNQMEIAKSANKTQDYTKAQDRYNYFADKLQDLNNPTSTAAYAADWEAKQRTKIMDAGGADLMRKLSELAELKTVVDIESQGNMFSEIVRAPSDNWTRYQQEVKALKDEYGEDVTNWLAFAERAENKTSASRTAIGAMQAGKDSPFTSSLASLGTNMVSGAGYLDVAAQKAQRAITGSDIPVDYNRPAQRASQMTTNVRQGVSEDMGATGKFLYNTGMSILDSAAVMAAGGAGTALLGGAAATNAMQEAVQRGASDEQALAVGVIAGGLEAVMEKLSIDNLFQLKTAGNAKDVILNILKQAGAEGTEEGLTNIANTLADALIMGNRSELQTQKRELIAQGYSEAAAEKMALKEWGKNLALDVAGGALSGGVFGSAKTGIDNIMPKLQQNTQATGNEQVAQVVQDMTGQNKNAPVNETETESTAVNTNPATHTPQEQAIIEEYQGSVDPSVVAFVNKWETLQNKNYKKKVKMTVAEVSERTASEIKNLLGLDVSDFTHVLSGGALEHVNRRHGKNGQADHSMADVNDIARVGYVLENYDDATLLYDNDNNVKTSKEIMNSDNTNAPLVQFRKKVNGTYYVVEAVPDSAAKNMRIVSMYMTKADEHKQSPNANGSGNTPNSSAVNGDTDQVLNMSQNDPQPTPEVPHGAHIPNPNIADAPEIVNGDIGDMGAKTSGFRHEVKESQSKTTPYYYEKNNIPEEGRADNRYTVVHRDESLHNARSRLEQDYDGEVTDLRSKTTWSDEEMLEGDLVLRKLREEAEQTGDWSKHREWAKVFAEHKTEAGRSLSVLAMLSNETGDAILSRAAATLEAATKGTDKDAVMQTTSEFATKFDAAVAEKNVDELVNIIKETARTRKTGFYSGKLGKITSLPLEKALERIANYAKAEPATGTVSVPQPKAFQIGDVVVPSDRGNYGKVAKVNDDGTYDVHFVSKTGHEAVKTFAADELKSPHTGGVTAADVSADPGSAFAFLKSFAAAGIENIANDTNRASVVEMAKTIRRNAMLSKFSTLMRNLVGNGTFDIADSIARDVSVPLDMLLSTITGTRSVAADYSYLSKAKRQGMMDGLAMAMLETSLDVNARDQKSKYENGSQRTFKMSGGIVSKLLSTWEGVMGYGLYVTDEMSKGGTSAEVQRGLNKLYEKGKIKVGDDSLRDGGAQEALYRTFQDDSRLARGTSKIKEGLNEFYGAGDLIMPFAQVPANLADRAIDYSPAGLVKSAKRLGEVLYKAKKGTLTAAEQAKAVQTLGRNITGSTLIALAANLAARGIIRVVNPGGEDENKDKAASEKAQGLNGTQWNLSAMLRDINGESAVWQKGDTLMSIAFLEPFNAHLTIGALLAEDMKAEGGLDFETLLKDSFGGSLMAICDLPMFDAFGEAYDAYQYSDKERGYEKLGDAGLALGANAVGSIMPNAWKGIAQGMDEYQRDLYSKDDIWGQTADQFRAVFARDSLPIKQDVYGNDVKNPDQPLSFLNANILPGAITTYTETDLQKSLNDLSEQTGKDSMYLSKDAPKSITVDDEKIELTAEQKKQFMSDRGDAYAAASSALENDETYRGFSKEWKLKAYEYAEDYATQTAKDGLGTKFEPSDWVSDLEGASPEELSEAMVQRVVQNMAGKAGENKYLGLETLLENKSIDDQMALACMSDSCYTAYTEQCEKAGISVQQFLDAYGTASANGETSAEKKQAALEYIQNMDMSAAKKGTLASAVQTAIGSFAPIKTEVSDQWLLDIGDTDRIKGQMSEDQLEKYEMYVENSGVRTQTYLDAVEFYHSDEAKGKKDKDGEPIDGESLKDHMIEYISGLNISDDKKDALYCGFYSEKTLPRRWK